MLGDGEAITSGDASTRNRLIGKLLFSQTVHSPYISETLDGLTALKRRNHI
jgi:hypothetical protein